MKLKKLLKVVAVNSNLEVCENNKETIYFGKRFSNNCIGLEGYLEREIFSVDAGQCKDGTYLKVILKQKGEI